MAALQTGRILSAIGIMPELLTGFAQLHFKHSHIGICKISYRKYRKLAQLFFGRSADTKQT